MPEIGSLADLVVFGIPLLGVFAMVVFRGDVSASQPTRLPVRGHQFSEIDLSGLPILIEPDGGIAKPPF